MKKMIRMAMMAAAMFVAVTTVAKAQGGGGGGGRGMGGRGPNMMVLLKDSLHVSEAVLTKADSITKAYAAMNAPLMEAARGGDADARTKMNENRTKQNEAIMALLTADQKAALEKMMPGRRGGGF